MKKMIQNKAFIFTSLLLLALGFSVYFVFSGAEKQINVGTVTRDTERSAWQIYHNSDYGFEIKFPTSWNVFEDLSSDTPTVNFYPQTFQANPPFTHFSPVTHVSIYPNGLPTGGIMGSQVDSTEYFIERELFAEVPKRVLEFTLNDNNTWAKMIQFENSPRKWDDWGFVWARYRVNNFREICTREGEEISEFECNIFEGDEIVRLGSIDNDSFSIINTMLESFNFRQ